MAGVASGGLGDLLAWVKLVMMLSELPTRHIVSAMKHSNLISDVGSI